MSTLNVQADLRKKLSDAFPDIVVKTKVPDPRPPTLIVVYREGGHKLNQLIDSPGIGVFCWAETEMQAEKIADQVADFFSALSFESGYASCEQEACYSDFDSQAKSPRWYLSYTLKTFKPKE